MTATDQPRDIVDEIGALVEEQLKQEPSGYDHNINQARCPHCGRHWHGLPVTAQIAMMYASGRYDSEYSVTQDDSPVLCPGSDFIGPIPPPCNSAQRLVAMVEESLHVLGIPGFPVEAVSSLIADAIAADVSHHVGRGFNADLIVFDEATRWILALERPRRRWLRLFGWTAVWFSAAVIGVALFPSWWIILTWPVQGLALVQGRAAWTEIRRVRRRRQRTATEGAVSARMVPAERRSDDGS